MISEQELHCTDIESDKHRLGCMVTTSLDGTIKVWRPNGDLLGQLPKSMLTPEWSVPIDSRRKFIKKLIRAQTYTHKLQLS